MARHCEVTLPCSREHLLGSRVTLSPFGEVASQPGRPGEAHTMLIALSDLVMRDTSKGHPVLTFSSLLCHVLTTED